MHSWCWADFSSCCLGREATFELKATGDHPGRQVTLKAAPVPANPFERFIVLIDQIAGILVVAAAAWLVWTRPGAMSWGFFLYVIWFNPGQVYAFYALLQPRPLLLLAQNLASAIAEAVGMWGSFFSSCARPTMSPTPNGDGLNACCHSSAPSWRCSCCSPMAI
jgi:hypothetical protein